LTFFCSSITKPLVGSLGFIRAFSQKKIEKKKVGTYNLREALNYFLNGKKKSLSSNISEPWSIKL